LLKYYQYSITNIKDIEVNGGMNGSQIFTT